MIICDKKTFEPEVLQAEGIVLVDFFGDGCVPCQALMPHIEGFAEKYGDKIKFCKLNVAENRRLVISLKVMAVPTILFYKGGENVQRISSDEVTLDAIREGAEKLLA